MDEFDWATPQGRLMWARDHAGLTRREVSDRTGISTKTIEAHENGRNLLRGLSTDHSALYARAYGVSENWLITGAGEPFGVKGGILRIPVRGYLQAGHWMESFEVAPPDQFDVAVTSSPSLAREPLYAAIVRGTSMDLVYPDGTIVILRKMTGGVGDLQPGKRYHVERTRPDGQVENTLKTVRRSNDGVVWLCPESTDPQFAAPVRLDAEPGSTIRLRGRVVMAIISE